MFKAIYHYLTLHRWEIGIVQNSFQDILDGGQLNVKWVKQSYRDRWFADPFVLDVTPTEIILLVEEYWDRLKKGRIAQLTICRDKMEVISMKIILELPTHLSFPAIIRKNGEVYIYPENFEGGSLKLYKYDLRQGKCNEVGVLVNEMLTDAVYTELLGEPTILSTKHPDPNGRRLGVYKKDDNGQFVLKKEAVFDENIARMAGDVFKYNGKIYRPSQESNKIYGHAVSIQEMTKKGEFKEVCRLYSPNPELELGLHTFNSYKGVFVIDAKGYRYKRLARVLSKIKNSLIHS